jgi:hypothetical protein
MKHITYLFFTIIAIALAGDTEAQYVSPYNSNGSARSAADAAAERAANSQRAYQNRVQQQQNMNSSAAGRTYGRRNEASEPVHTYSPPAAPVETPEQARKRKAEEQKTAVLNKKTTALNESANDAIEREDAAALYALVKGDDYLVNKKSRNISIEYRDVHMGIFESRMARKTKDDVNYFAKLRIAKQLWGYPMPKYTYVYSEGTEDVDIVKFKLMILMGEYAQAIASLRPAPECYFGCAKLKRKDWDKTHGFAMKHMRGTWYENAKEVSQFTNYMAGRCFEVMNMPDSASRYLDMAGDYSEEWDRLAAYQHTMSWSAGRPMLAAKDANRK